MQSVCQPRRIYAPAPGLFLLEKHLFHSHLTCYNLKSVERARRYAIYLISY